MSSQGRILVVDDEFHVRDSLQGWFKLDGYEVDTAEDARAALQCIRDHRYDVILLDLKMPGMDGITLQRRIREIDASIAVIMITAFATVDSAVQALKQGAFDYITKPVDPDELAHLVKRAREQQRLVDENQRLRQNIDEITGVETIVGESAPMRAMMELIRHVAGTDATVMIRGETGTGKELVARAVHALSDRRYFPIVPVSCGSIPDGLLESELFGHEKGAFTGARYRRKGKLEMAHGGTLFLDEVGSITPKTQVDLLRVLESKEFTRLGGMHPIKVDFRIICATNEDLERYVEDGRFREDLYYRINVFNIEVPPLRDRPSDIPLLARHFLKRFARQLDLDIRDIEPEAMALLCGHPWPGNVRELANAMERAVVMGRPPVLKRSDLSMLPTRAQEPPAGDTLEDIERRHIQAVLEQLAWNISAASSHLGIDRSTLYAKIKRYGLRK